MTRSLREEVRGSGVGGGAHTGPALEGGAWLPLDDIRRVNPDVEAQDEADVDGLVLKRGGAGPLGALTRIVPALPGR